MGASSPRNWGRHLTGPLEAQLPSAGREADRSTAVPAHTICRPTPATNQDPAKRRSLFSPDPPWAETISPWQSDLDTCPPDLHRLCKRGEILEHLEVTLAAPQPDLPFGDPRPTVPLHGFSPFSGGVDSETAGSAGHPPALSRFGPHGAGKVVAVIHDSTIGQGESLTAPAISTTWVSSTTWSTSKK